MKISKKSLGILLIGALYCSSCTDVTVVDVFQQAVHGPEATVRVLINTDFKTKREAISRSTASDVNEGPVLQPMQNAVLAAYVEEGDTGFDSQDRSYSAINIGTIDLESGKTTTKTLNTHIGKVNFLFYGNGNTGTWSGFSSFAQGSYLSSIQFMLEKGTMPIPDGNSGDSFRNPPALLYWGHTTGLEILDQQLPEQQISLDDIHYGVGNLITVVKDATTGEGHLLLNAVFVGNQPAAVGWNFTPGSTPSERVTIYDNQLNIGNNPIVAYLPKNYPTTLTPATINDYTLVFPTLAGEDVPVALAVTSTVDIELNSGVTVPAGTVVYLPPLLIKALLVPAGLNQQVFIGDYKTIARFAITTLKNGNIVPIPLTKADVTVDITVSTEWKEGVTLDYEIP